MARRDPAEILPPLYHHAPPRKLTFGPIVGKLAASVGYAPDPEQQLILDDVFAYKEGGVPSCFEYGIIGPRQQLKTGTLIQCALGWLFVMPPDLVRNINWTAHLKDTAKKSFYELADVITSAPELKSKLKRDKAGGIHTGKDMEKIVTADGRTLDVSARTERSGRGLTGDRIVLDEALYLTPAMMGALMPTLTARRGSQAVYASTAGKASSETLRLKRDQGRSGSSPSLGWAEWGSVRKPCDDSRCTHYPPGHPAHVSGCAMDDPDTWVQASPLLGRTRPNGTGLSMEKLANLRESMPPSEWGREFLVWWDEPNSDDVFGDGVWQAATAAYTDEDGTSRVGLPPTADFPLTAIGVAVAADLTSASIVGAGPRGDRTAVKVIATNHGIQWVPDYVADLNTNFPKARVVVDPGGPTGTLVTELERRVKPSRRFVKISFPQWKAACAGMWAAIQSGDVEHGGQPELDEAVADAKQRTIVDRWVWERYGYNASPLEAATLAVWAVDNEPRRSPYEDRGVLTV